MAGVFILLFEQYNAPLQCNVSLFHFNFDLHLGVKNASEDHKIVSLVR